MTASSDDATLLFTFIFSPAVITNFLPLKKSRVVPPFTCSETDRCISVLSALMSFTSMGRDAPVVFVTEQPIKMDFLAEGTVYTSTAVVPMALDVWFLNSYAGMVYPNATAIATARLSM